MGPADVYSGCRARLLELSLRLDERALHAPLAATPPWTVLDGYRHLAGVCSDVLDGVLDGAGTPEWTAAQLSTRADRSIVEVVAEWGSRGRDLEARIRETGERMAFAAFDAWTHEQDIRAAVGQVGLRDPPDVAVLAQIAVRLIAPRYLSSGAPPFTVVLDGEPHRVGDGDAVATLETTSYEVLRIIFGRRSRAQVEAAGWKGDAAAVIDAFHMFEFPPGDITD